MAMSGCIKQNIPEIENGITVLEEKAEKFLNFNPSGTQDSFGDGAESAGQSVETIQNIDYSVYQSLEAWGQLIETLSAFVNADLSRMTEADMQ